MRETDILHGETVCRHDTPAALRLLLVMLGVSIPVWIFTPVVASFASLLIPQLMTAVFVPGENNGRSTGDAPYSLYTELAVLLVVGCILVLVLNLVFGMRMRHTWAPVVLGAVGVVAFLWAVTTFGGAPWQWAIAPLSIVAGAAAGQALTTAEDARRGRPCVGPHGAR